MEVFDFAAWRHGRTAWIERVLRHHAQRLHGRSPPRLWEAMTYSLEAGGKRIRPLLVAAWSECDRSWRDDDLDSPLARAACAIEWIHTYSLIHDDLPAMDDDSLRRGKPTSHVVFGEALAILAGDALLTEAFGMLVEGAAGLARGGRLVAAIAGAAGAGGMVGGQVLDMQLEQNLTVDQLSEIHRRKTGALLAAACRLGVIAVDGPTSLEVTAESFGFDVGLAFQIVDDVLDVTATTGSLGKTPGKDAQRGQATFVSLLGVRGARNHADQVRDRALGLIASLDGRAEAVRALAVAMVNRTS